MARVVIASSGDADYAENHHRPRGESRLAHGRPMRTSFSEGFMTYPADLIKL